MRMQSAIGQDVFGGMEGSVHVALLGSVAGLLFPLAVISDGEA